MTAYGLSQGLKIPKADADRFIRTYFQRYQGVDRFLKETIQLGGGDGVRRARSWAGAGKSTPSPARNKTEKSAAERVAVNSPIQGTAADLMKLAMVKLHSQLRSPRACPRASSCRCTTR